MRAFPSKMKKIIIFVVCSLGLVISENEVEKAFKENEIVSDVVSKAPEKLLNVEFKQSDKKAELGNELTPTQVRQPPEVKYDADSDSYYTLIMTDPDAPSRKNPIRREWHHWLVVNIPGDKVGDGEALSEYIGSAPPKDSGLHRYVLLLYKQPGKLEFDEPRHSNRDGKRGNFSAEKFAKKYNLGDPIAGNFYQAQFDDIVPEIHKSLA